MRAGRKRAWCTKRGPWNEQSNADWEPDERPGHAADTKRRIGVYVHPCGAAAVRRPKRGKANGLFQRRMLAGVSGELRQVPDKGQQSRGARQYPNRSYEDKQGNKRTITEIIADEVEFLSRKVETQAPVYEDIADNELPF